MYTIATNAPCSLSRKRLHVIAIITHADPACYRRRNQWPRLALRVTSFCLPLISSVWLVRIVYLTQRLLLLVLMNIGCDDCNDDGRTSPGSAVVMERGEAVCMCVRKIKQNSHCTSSYMMT